MDCRFDKGGAIKENKNMYNKFEIVYRLLFTQGQYNRRRNRGNRNVFSAVQQEKVIANYENERE